MKITPFRKFRNKRNEQKRYKRRLARLEKCGDFQVIQIDGIKVARGKNLNLGHIFEGDGILIVEEIFKNDEYNFDISDRAVVIDIGMNIGLASLYFAARDDVEEVYGFEPFKPTFEQAIFNFKINDKYGGKIHPHNYGLGDRDKELTCEYYSKAPGRMSTVQSIDKIRHSSKYAKQMKTVQVRNAAEELRPIIERHKEKAIIVKCDTEGAEKENFREPGFKRNIEEYRCDPARIPLFLRCAPGRYAQEKRLCLLQAENRHPGNGRFRHHKSRQ